MIQTRQKEIAGFCVVTEREFEKLPETNRKVEVVDGVLRVSPDPTVAHQYAMLHLAIALLPFCPPEFDVVPGTDVKIAGEPLHARSPDLLVIPKGTERMMPPSSVVLAVEIVSPSTRTQDRVHKHAEYAQAGIANYWIVDLAKDVVSLEVFCLEARSGTYVRRGIFATDDQQPIRIATPFPCTIDLNTLAR